MEILLGERQGRGSDPAPEPLSTADDDLARYYPWPAGRRWLRVVMLRTLDGAVAGPDGRSRSISSPADRAVLAATRRLSDVILVGASTVREEPYGALSLDAQALAERRAAGLADAPAIAVVSGSLDLPWSEPMFASPSQRLLVLTTLDADPTALAAAREHAEVVQLPGARLEPSALVDALERLGLRRIGCEGGPGLVAALVGAGVVDEVDLSLSPLLAGGTSSSAASRAGRDVQPDGFDLVQVIADDGFLFTRYVARRHREASQDRDLGSAP